MSTFLITFCLPIAAYFIGAVPSGWILVRWVAGADVRRIGSGNMGATNVRRAIGSRWAAATLVCDVLKGFLPTLAAYYYGPFAHPWIAPVTALAAICGHMYPVYFGFRPSGKGVATTLGALLVIAPWACLCAVSAFLVAAKVSRRVSVGSLAGTFLLPPTTWYTSHDLFLTLIILVIMVLILARHAENIERLAQGNEPVLGKKQ